MKLAATLLAAITIPLTCQVQAYEDYAPYAIQPCTIVFDYSNAVAADLPEGERVWSREYVYRPYHNSGRTTFVVGYGPDHEARFGMVSDSEYARLEPRKSLIRLHGIEHDVDCYLYFITPTSGTVLERHDTGYGLIRVTGATFTYHP